MVRLLIAVLLLTAMGYAWADGPTIFVPGVISGPTDDEAPVFTPDGKSVYLFRRNGSDYYIVESHQTVSGWSQPVIAPFSGHWRDLEPAMAPDGSYLIFASSRPHTGSDKPIDGSWSGKDYPGKGGNLWRVDRVGDGWSEPKRLPDVINRSNAVFSPAIAADGTLYFMEAAGVGMHFRLFYSQLKDGRYQPPQPLPFTTGQYGGADAAVAPDQSFIVFSSNRPPTPQGQSDLFIAYRSKDGTWDEPVALPDAINRYAPLTESRLGPDGHTLYICSSYVVPPTYPKDSAAAAKDYQDMLEWNNGLDNIWQVDLTPYLQHTD